MIDPATLLVFCLAALALLATPGPAVLYVVTRSIAQGPRAGLVSCLGLTTGGLAHVAAAAGGLSALMMTSAVAFNAVKLLGAGYLVYLGISTWLRGASAADASDEIGERSLWQVYRQGVIVNLLNPKAALFFLAFLPQFVDPSRSAPPQILLLGGVFLLLGVITDSAYAVTAGTVSGFVRSGSRAAAVQRYVSGGVYVALGLATALGERPASR